VKLPGDFPPAVELRQVCKRFGTRLILDRVDLTIARGEVVVLVGQSGCGKSTLLKMISGIEMPDSGQVLLAGNDCTALPPHRRAVHTVFQNYALFPHLDVADNVAFPLAVAGMARPQRERRVQEALGWVKLEPHARRRVNSLSGGERQRVALARALVDSPQCVLLDEPLSALDPHLREKTLELLQGIQTRLGATFLFITHDREEAMRLGQRIGVLNAGRLEQIGTPEEVYRHPRTAFVASFLGKINWLRGEVERGHGGDRLVVAGASVPSVFAGQTASGPVKVGIRPEDVWLDANGPVAARIVRRQFLGDSTVLHLQLTSGEILLADQRGPGENPPTGEGEVRLSWAAEAAHVFPHDQPGAIPVEAAR
jgi:ABC-type Fe3+/spermidine/putrescine transport system ATPase subunit